MTFVEKPSFKTFGTIWYELMMGRDSDGFFSTKLVSMSSDTCSSSNMTNLSH